MSEPSLTWTTPSSYTATADGAITTFLYRGGYYAESRTTEYDTWITWAASNGDSDEQAITNTYSSYAFTTWIDTNGIPFIATTL